MSKQITFNSIPSHNKIVAKTNVNPTKTQCYTIYDNITKGLPIINPKTGFVLNYDSPITQKILRICYKQYKMKKLPDVIDPRNLFGNKTPPQLSPSSASPSPPGVPTRSPSPPGVASKLKAYLLAAKTNKQPSSPPGAKTKKQSRSPPQSPSPSPPGATADSTSPSSSSYGPPQSPSPPSSLPSSPLPPPSSKIKKKKQSPTARSPSPPAARKQSPTARSPSPPAARKQSPVKRGQLKKLSFEGVPDTIKTAAHKKPYNNLTTDQCKYVVTQCKDVMQKIADEKSVKPNKYQIINPITDKNIFYTSPITKYLLYSCYYDKNIKDVEDVVEIKTLCDKPPAVKINYNDILTKFKALKLNYTEDKLTELFVETKLDATYLTHFKNYITSCKQIEKRKTIDFDTVCKHFEIIFNLLNVNSKSRMAFYDDRFLDDLRSSGYNSVNIVENKLPISYSNLYNYTDIVSDDDAININDKPIILRNSIFNRIYVLSYKQNIIEFCPYNKSRLSLDELDKISTIIKNSNKTVPKYFAHSYQDDTETTNKLNYITTFLTTFATDFVSNMEIIEPDSVVKINELEQKIPNIKRNECYDLATLLYHNAIFNNLKMNTPIVGVFNGTVNRSTVNAFQYLFKLLDIQTYNIDRGKLYEIESNYKNNGRHPLSKNLNIELSNLIIDPNFTLSNSVKQRLVTILTSMQSSDKQNDYSKSLFLFHGTSNKLNSDLLTSFLSTSFNVDIAIRYSNNNSNPHMYVFRINSNNIKYINFADTLHQVLLLPGTKIIEKCILKYHNYTFIVCDLEMANTTYLANILNNIKTYNSKYTIEDYSLVVKNYTDDYIKVVIYNQGDFANLSSFKYSDNIKITNDDKYLTCNLLSEASSVNNLFLNLKYTIHQLIINNIYSYFMNDKVMKYNIIYFNTRITTDNNILIGWEYDRSLTSTISNPNYKYDYDFLIIDLLCNNFDLANKLSYLLTTDNKVKKVWFKATGIFNGVACQTVTENDSKDSSKLNAIFEKDINTIIETNLIFKNNKKDIKPFVDKYMDLIQKFKTDGILDKIISAFKLFIENNLSIPHSSEEHKQLQIFIDIIKSYFNAKVDYMLSLNRNDLITTINSKMQLTGGKDKELSPDSPKISKKSKSSTKKLIMNTDPTIFDKEGYEITPQYYSSTHTISSSSLKSIKAFTKLRN
jgi:hypothetical protein